MENPGKLCRQLHQKISFFRDIVYSTSLVYSLRNRLVNLVVLFASCALGIVLVFLPSLSRLSSVQCKIFQFRGHISTVTVLQMPCYISHCYLVKQAWEEFGCYIVSDQVLASISWKSWYLSYILVLPFSKMLCASNHIVQCFFRLVGYFFNF